MIEPREITEHFRLERVLKSSRSGIVFRAIDPTSQDPVVIKLITPGGPGDQRLGFEHFSTAVQALTRVRIPGFPLLLDWGWTPDMSAFMVMERLDGERLDGIAGAPPARILGLLTELVDSLEALAAAGIVHGNLAPENLIAVPEEAGEHIAVLGFGTAAFRWPTMAPVRWGLESSTADFMAPEWVTPPAGSAPDWRADLYAFAQTACRLLNVDVLDIGDGPPTIALPPQVHELVPDGDYLEAILAQALEHDPALRPASWDIIREAFKASNHAADAADASPYRTQRISHDRSVPAATIRIPLPPAPEPTRPAWDDSDIGRTKVISPERLSAIQTNTVAAQGTAPAAGPATEVSPDGAAPGFDAAPGPPALESVTPAADEANPPEPTPPQIADRTLERTEAIPAPGLTPLAGEAPLPPHDEAVQPVAITEAGATLTPATPTSTVIDPAATPDAAATRVGEAPAEPIIPAELTSEDHVWLAPVSAAAATLLTEVPSELPASDATSASDRNSEDEQQNLSAAEGTVPWPTPAPAVPPPPPPVPHAAEDDGQRPAESADEQAAPQPTGGGPEAQARPPAAGPAGVPETTRVVAPAAPPAQRPTPQPARTHRRWWPWALAAGLVIAALGIGGILLWQQQEAVAARIRSAARPTPRPPTRMATPRPFAPPAAVAVVDALADALGRGDLKLARQTLDQLTPETRATLPAEEVTRLGELETAFVAARREQTLKQLKRGLQASDIRVIRDALASATREDLALFARDADTAQTVEEARRAVDVYGLLQRAAAAGNHSEVLQEAQTLLQLLAKSSQAIEARDKAAAALEAQADVAVRGGQWDLATSRLDTVRKFWPDRPGLAARFDRIASEREADERIERVISAAGRAEAERQPEKGLDALRSVTPTVRTRARWDEARGRLERLLVEVDAAAPVVVLRPGFKLQYEKNKLATIAVRASDDHAVKEVRFLARVEGTPTFQSFPANRGAAGEWSVELAPSFHGNKTVEFYVVATDASGHAGSLGSAEAPLRIKKKGWLF